MLSIPLGPIALPLAPVLLALSVWLAAWLADRIAARVHVSASGAPRLAAGTAGNRVLGAAFVGLLAARLVWIAQHAGAYAATPLAVLDVRDGGWHMPAGLLAGLAWLAWHAVRQAALRRPLAIGAAAGLALWLGATLALAPREVPGLPGVELVALDSGAPTDLTRAARGRPLVVNLWASWCGPCRVEMPVLVEAQRAQAGRGAPVGFLFVNQGESADAVARYLRSLPEPPQEVLLDAGSRLGPLVGSSGLPTTLFYDAHGRRVDAHFGVLNAAALQARLQRLQPTR